MLKRPSVQGAQSGQKLTKCSVQQGCWHLLQTVFIFFSVLFLSLYSALPTRSSTHEAQRRFAVDPDAEVCSFGGWTSADSGPSKRERASAGQLLGDFEQALTLQEATPMSWRDPTQTRMNRCCEDLHLLRWRTEWLSSPVPYQAQMREHSLSTLHSWFLLSTLQSSDQRCPYHLL